MTLFDSLQYRMAEVLFRPFRSIKIVWKGPRPTRRNYRIAAGVLIIAGLGFGALMLNVFTGTSGGFRDTQSWIHTVALMFINIWSLFMIYVVLTSIVFEFIAFVRRN